MEWFEEARTFLEERVKGAAVALGRIDDSWKKVVDSIALPVSGWCEKRKREFLAGRAAAGEALGRLGMEQPGLPARAEDGRPLWPPGITGSISHSRQYCAAVAAYSCDFAAIGIDIEEGGRVDRAIAERLFTVQELDFLERGAAKLPLPVARTVIFSAKESAYKAVYGLRGGKGVSALTTFEVALGQGGGLAVRLTGADASVQGCFYVSSCSTVVTCAWVWKP